MNDNRNRVIINLSVQELEISAQRVAIPTWNKNFIWLQFTFSDNWEGLQKIAILSRQNENVEPLHIPLCTEGTCRIPSHLMEKVGNIVVSVFSPGRKTVGIATIPVVESGYKDGQPAPPDIETDYSFIITPDGSVPFIKEEDNIFRYFSAARQEYVDIVGGGSSDFRIDSNTLRWQQNTLFVNTTDKVDEHSTRPMTAAGVHVILGNIHTLLEVI